MDAVQNKYLASPSPWVRSFDLSKLKILIVCRGPIRKEALDVFAAVGVEAGILLSEKDSVTYAQTLAPELRQIKNQDLIHRVPDYSGASGEERKARIEQIIRIAQDYRYTHIFAGYGFMAEDAGFVEAIEQSGLGFMGPSSHVQRLAGSKDEAKKLARRLNVSVTPGVDNITALTLIRKAGKTLEELEAFAAKNGLQVAAGALSPEDYAEAILQAGYQAGRPLISLEELQGEARRQLTELFRDNPGKRFRLKYIGGGGGKGQRIIAKIEDTDEAIFQVLSESKAMGPADNKNFLIELNIEETRHNEIQLLGNGEWSIALGGRDCSLQMHEQKLVEISITRELFEHELQQALADSHDNLVEELKRERDMLASMEAQAESFGRAVKLDSASTFECIVAGNSFYFMEMNTRIQVEHRVTEMVYSLRFTSPENPGESFVVDSLVEAMALVAAHKSRLPRPERISRHTAGGEIRLNATNDALQPAAGGRIEFWSPPVSDEIRDDQGIGIRNPDTGGFIHYYLAGAYDSNIALIVTHGRGRRDMLERLADILRRTELRGQDLATNLSFHYGILNFCLGLHPMLTPSTRFVPMFLSASGALARVAQELDLEAAWTTLVQATVQRYGKEMQQAIGSKLTLVLRPISVLLSRPHEHNGWFVRNHNRAFRMEGERMVWLRNPLHVLNDLYRYLNLEFRPDSGSRSMWDHDHELLQKGLGFYADLEFALELDSEGEYRRALDQSHPNSGSAYRKLDASLRQGQLDGEPGSRIREDLFRKCAESHLAWQAGLALLEIPIRMGFQARLHEFTMDIDLKPRVPDLYARSPADLIKALAPPPAPTGKEILAVTGGMFYTRESPDRPPLVEKGQHFNAGDPLYVLEVMKMFNKVYAEFSGTVTNLLVDGDKGHVVRKGQPLFAIEPDEEIVLETDAEKAARQRKATAEFMAQIEV
ncbi:MAG: biotin carboxylase [Spirochaetales bacterium]|nr:biotin carboxylase [Spirochaetales bacterium]